jgi:hypothetical protein
MFLTFETVAVGDTYFFEEPVGLPLFLVGFESIFSLATSFKDDLYFLIKSRELK